MAKLIKLQNISKIYRNDKVATPAVKNVSFSVAKGEFVAVMGPSGSGKSTLMQIMGFLDRPTKGDYFFEGKNSKYFTQDELAKIRNEKIGFVFQTFNLLSRTTVFENIELPLLYNRSANNKNNKNLVKKALEAVFLGHRAHYFSNQLSGGEKQRVAIARALVNNPPVILADEPTGNLDSKSGLQIMRILQDLNDRGSTVILITHETYTAEHAKRIIRIKDGSIEEDFTLKKRKLAINGHHLK